MIRGWVCSLLVVAWIDRLFVLVIMLIFWCFASKRAEARIGCLVMHEFVLPAKQDSPLAEVIRVAVA